jgi:hypothetical protein
LIKISFKIDQNQSKTVFLSRWWGVPLRSRKVKNSLQTLNFHLTQSEKRRVLVSKH